MEGDKMEDIGENRCLVCGCDKPKVFVHGHYQCADCKCVADGDCCQGASIIASTSEELGGSE